MGLFSKKKNIRFPSSRDVEAADYQREKEHIKDMEHEYRLNHPTRLDKIKADARTRAIERQEMRKLERQAYKEEFLKARIARRGEQGRHAGSTTMGDRVQRIARQPSIGASRPRSNIYRFHDNYNPFGSMFDTGMSYHPKKSGGKRYAVIGGKAYQIAGKGKHKKKSHRKSSSGFDMYDNWGFMK